MTAALPEPAAPDSSPLRCAANPARLLLEAGHDGDHHQVARWPPNLLGKVVLRERGAVASKGRALSPSALQTIQSWPALAPTAGHQHSTRPAQPSAAAQAQMQPLLALMALPAIMCGLLVLLTCGMSSG